MNTNQTTTRNNVKRRKPQTTTGMLKMILAAGTLISTMIGANLLAAKDQTPVVVQSESGSSVAVVVPEMHSGSFQGIDLSSLPDLTIPQPFASSKSSG